MPRNQLSEIFKSLKYECKNIKAKFPVMLQLNCGLYKSWRLDWFPVEGWCEKSSITLERKCEKDLRLKYLLQRVVQYFLPSISKISVWS
jgi:hypothetical protein